MGILNSYQGINGLFKKPHPNQFVIHLFESRGEEQNLALALMTTAITDGNTLFYLTDEKKEAEYFDKQISQLRSKLPADGLKQNSFTLHIKFANIYEDVKKQLNKLGSKVEDNKNNTPVYLIIKISEASMPNFDELMDKLENLNSYLFLHYQAFLLIQLDTRAFTSLQKELLKSIYPVSIINGRLFVNQLYSSQTNENNSGLNNELSSSNPSVTYLNLAMYEADENGNITYFNNAFKELTGFTLSELSTCQEYDLVRGRKELGPIVNLVQGGNDNIYLFNTQYRTKREQLINTEEVLFQIEGSPTIYHLINANSRPANTNQNSIQGIYNGVFYNLLTCVIRINPLYNNKGDLYDFEFLYHNKLIRGLEKYFNKDLMSNFICPHHLWQEAISRALMTDQQIFFEIPDKAGARLFNVILFSSSHQEIIALIIDVTMKKKIADYYQKQVVFLQDIMDGIPTPTFYRDTDGNFQYANKAFEIALGLSREDILGKSLFKVLPEDLAAKYRAMDIDLLKNAGIQTYEWEFQHADGSRHNVVFNKAPLSNSENEFIGVVGTFIDITQRKIMQNKLSLSEDKFRNMFDQSPLGIVLFTPTGKLVDMNMAAQDILGIEKKEDIEYFATYFDNFFKPVNQTMLGNTNIISYEEELDFEIIRKLGLFHTSKTGKSYVRYYINPLRYGESGIAGYMVHIQDITEQKKATQALQASEESLRRLTDNMIDMVSQVDLTGNYEYISPSSEKVLGFSPDEMIGRSFYDFLHPQDIDKVKADFNAAFLSKSFAKFEYRYKCKNGNYIYLETLVNFMFDNNNRICGSVLVTRDISDRKRMEGELSKLDRLKTIGEMAAGLGHEIRNPMTTVRGFLQMLGTNAEFINYKDVFDLMIKELDDANSIITEFLSLAKDKPLELETENLNNILMAIYPLLSADAIKCDKQVIMDLKPVPDLMLDAKEIRQLVFNLTRNGLEAMPDGGVLNIRTYDEDNRIVLEVQDQGSGIDEKILENLGTPFYTTKEMGIGLGLPICFNIASRHNATIEVDTSAAGTTFYIRFAKTKQ